jgi:hypothetical protein
MYRSCVPDAIGHGTLPNLHCVSLIIRRGPHPGSWANIGTPAPIEKHRLQMSGTERDVNSVPYPNKPGFQTRQQYPFQSGEVLKGVLPIASWF